MLQSSKKIALLLLKNPYLEYLDIAEVDQTISSLIYFTTVMRLDQPMYNETLKILDISRPNPGCMYFFNAEQFATLIGHMLRVTLYFIILIYLKIFHNLLCLNLFTE